MKTLNVKLELLPAMELSTYAGELGVGGTSESLAPLVGFKPWKEDRGDIDEDEGPLCNWITMIYEEG